MMPTRMIAGLAAVALAASAGLVPVDAEQAQDKVPIVAVAGCLTEPGPNDWILTNATEPEPSIANGPPAGQPYAGPTSGKNTFKLIGVSEFDLPSHKGHTVLVKALFIKASPMSRLNITSVTMVSASCTPAPK